ncbi:hypothetical protein KORDIASMS9_04015 [Kordia sp. SMS9]|uniref:hypothetical protein n=1 Tax=Kordia sp. SMS9 TaxID=2282170 RepID=UPI000E0D9EFA|nr:hypothetical protein [Kordia sp. SMS9]AXG71757.1 hypothetical protein KORDIASMS9_04015 [Kordia sp. SMS9]
MKKELIFIFFILLVFYGIHGFPTSMERLEGVSTIDINVYDTYYVISSKYYWILTLLFAFSMSYLVRILVTKFRNRIANYIFLIVNALFIVSLVYVIRFFNTILRDFKERAVAIDQAFYNFFYIATAFFVFTIIFEIYVLFKMQQQK